VHRAYRKNNPGEFSSHVFLPSILITATSCSGTLLPNTLPLQRPAAQYDAATQPHCALQARQRKYAEDVTGIQRGANNHGYTARAKLTY
jgi:hypothetical protein